MYMNEQKEFVRLTLTNPQILKFAANVNLY